MYTLHTLWVICDPEMNFEVMPVKGYVRIDTDNAQNLFSRCQTFYRNRKETGISGAFNILKKKRNGRNTNDSDVCI